MGIMGDATINAAILAAGEGKRLRIREAKALAPLLGKRMIDFPIMEFGKFVLQASKAKSTIGVVVGHMREEVIAHFRGVQSEIPLRFAVQERQLGTADALRAYFRDIEEAAAADYTLVLCADTPLIREKDLTLLWERICAHPELVGVAATFIAPDPRGYGRIVRQSAGNGGSGGNGGSRPGFHIVEEKDIQGTALASICEVNSGLYIFKTSFLKKSLLQINANNQAGEFYLTDVFQDHLPVEAILFEGGKDKFEGVNSLLQLEEAEAHLRREKLSLLREQGVRFLDAATTYIDWDVQIGRHSLVYPGVVLQGKVIIGEEVVLESGVVIKNSRVERGAVIHAYSCLEDALVRAEAAIGPFARLRPHADIGEKAKVGNFVEVKKSKLASGVKVSHLSYVGDAEIGANTNIGCGFITCNYDGVEKHKTVVGKDVFVGSDCQVVAPLEIGDGAFVGAGSTITQSVPADAFAIARSRQVTREGMAGRFLRKGKKKDNK